jgi:hypothetical protein
MASVTVAQVEQDLTDHLANNLPTGITNAQVKWANAPFVTPNNAPWLRATMISPVVIDQDASGCYREYQGQFIVDVFHPKDTGTRAALNMANEIAESLNRTAFNYSYSIAGEVEVIGEEESTPWFHVRAVSTYQFGSFSED